MATKSTATKRHGCIIVKGGRVIGRGYNVYKTNPFIASENHMDRCSVHAEVAAIKNVRGSLKGATIYVARINKRGEVRYSKPCSNCQSVINECGIRKVLWSE